MSDEEIVYHMLKLDIGYADKRLLLNWLGLKRVPPNINKTRISGDLLLSEILPDWCACCGYDYGFTIAGRIRKGCPSCKGRVDIQHNGLMSDWLWYTGDTTGIRLLRLIKKYGAI